MEEAIKYMMMVRDQKMQEAFALSEAIRICLVLREGDDNGSGIRKNLTQ